MSTEEVCSSDTGRYLKLCADMETGRDEMEPHQREVMQVADGIVECAMCRWWKFAAETNRETILELVK